MFIKITLIGSDGSRLVDIKNLDAIQDIIYDPDSGEVEIVDFNGESVLVEEPLSYFEEKLSL